ncbi:MFS transporter [Thiomicrospira sp. R3]|uniref:MFS transporter n=1 Tax=Thiomicrospira sp. R3 TaxID=3035472 RepID=UPI00259BA6D0|nr:MFS transporter [Thiomicrospira sp. R3]WFE67788.1 MFS transporter [Thiomicrospira sp. R3]
MWFSRAWTQPLIYGLPAWPLAMLGIPLYIYLPNYYHQMGVELALIGAMLLLARVTDVISDPLIGVWRDKLTIKSRKSMVGVGWLLLLVSLWQLLLPAQASAGHLLVWALLVYLAWSLIMIPYQAMTAEVTRQVHRKTHFTASREALAILGVVSVLLLPVILDLAPDSRDFFSLLFPLIALSLSLFLGLMLWRLRLPVVAKKPTLSASSKRGLLRLIWQDPASRQLLPAYFLNSLANALPATLFILFVDHYLELSTQTGVLLLAFFIAGILALPGWTWLAKRIGKYQAWRGSMLLACISFVWVFTLESGDFTGFLIISFISGLSLGADVALPSSIQADIAQRLSQQQGALNGLLFGIWGMLTKLALALAVGIAFPILGWLGWEQQTQQSLDALVWLYAGLPVFIKLLVLFLLKNTK